MLSPSTNDKIVVAWVLFLRSPLSLARVVATQSVPPPLRRGLGGGFLGFRHCERVFRLSRNDDRGMFCYAHNDEKCCHIEVSQETEISLFDST